MADLDIKTLPPCSGRTLVVGDIHGCAEEFAIMVEAFSPAPGDRIIAVGDLINRGPDSAGVLQLARERGVEAILGNHEQRLLEAWRNSDPDCLKPKDRKTYTQLDEADWEWIATWPHVLRIPSLNTLIVHGGFVPGTPWQEQDPDLVTKVQVLDGGGRPRSRSELPAGKPWAASWKGPEHVVYGHTPRPHPLLSPHATGLDTGCVYGYTLTGISLPEREFFRVHARGSHLNG